jgi:hypothetical protein
MTKQTTNKQRVVPFEPGNNVIANRIIEPRATVEAGVPPLVWVHGSIETDPPKTLSQAANFEATSLAFQMSPRAAIELALQISRLVVQMDWQLPEGVVILGRAPSSD